MTLLSPDSIQGLKCLSVGLELNSLGRSIKQSSLSIGRLFRSTSAKVGISIVFAILAMVFVGSFLVPYSPYATSGQINSAPTFAHPFGTDYLGHDILSEIVWGAYPSMLVAVVAALGAALLGLVAGIVAGYFERVGSVVGFVTDLVLTFSPIPFLMLIGTLFEPSNQLIIALLIFVLWAPIARSIRPQVSRIKKAAYVDAERLSGTGDVRIAFKVIASSVAPIASAYFIINVAAATIIVTALEFLGVGNPDIVSWGSILYWAQQFGFYSGDWWWILAPGLTIALIAIGFGLMGFSIEEVLNPRLRVG